MNLQEIISKLNEYWSRQGCVLLQPYDVEKGAATLGPHTFLRSLGSQPWSVAYVEPCRRPIDARYAVASTDRYQHYYQYQVLLKPAPDCGKKLFLQSLSTLGISSPNSVSFIDDAWESPVFGAKGVGWEVWFDDSEIAQLTYLNVVGDIQCNMIPLEITYGLERLALKIQGKSSFSELNWSSHITYGDIYFSTEVENSVYILEKSNPERLRKLLDILVEETKDVIEYELVYPALDYILKSAHVFNLLDAKGALDEQDKVNYIQGIRRLANKTAKLFVQQQNLE
jgi:glycyl-tRNA synthetase alpha chain